MAREWAHTYSIFSYISYIAGICKFLSLIISNSLIYAGVTDELQERKRERESRSERNLNNAFINAL